jgi:integrase
MWSIAEARDLVGRAQAMLRDRTGIPDTDWLDRQRSAAGKGEPVRQVEAVPPRQLFRWTFEEGRRLYLDDIQRTRRPATHADYRGMLMLPDLDDLEGRALPTITRQELATIIARVHRSGRESTAEHLVRVLRPMWKWLADDARVDKSGVAPGILDRLAAPERTLDEQGDDAYVPPLEEVGRIIAIARSGAVDSIIGSAIELSAWTAQRRRTIVEAKVDQLEPIGDGTRGLWHIPPASRKSRRKGGARKRDHVIPLPAPAWACVTAAAARARALESDWLFPQLRLRRAGGDRDHLHENTLTHTLSYLPGIAASPHALRRAFATHGESRFGLLRADTQAILDHAAGAGDVTGRHYALHDGTSRTWAIMTTWCEGIQPSIDAAIDELEPVEELRAAIARARYGGEDRAAAE